MKNYLRKILSILLVITIFTVSFAGTKVNAYASGSGDDSGTTSTGKYVKEIFIAYGRTEADAVAWLEANGWEPIKGDARDFNAGKNSVFDKSMAAVMGIHRTDDKDEAITDMAVMNMKGGYSVPNYEKLVSDKQTDIDEFINRFLPAIEEFRENYNEEGSEDGKKRADIAYEVLNTFVDGKIDDPYKRNDTFRPIGELFLEPTRQEGGKEGLDLNQMILEGNGPAVMALEQMLVLGADSGEESWLMRLSALSGSSLVKNLPKYVPEAAGQNLSPSAVNTFLNQYYGDAARTLSEQWGDIHADMLWFENYSTENSLWQDDGESDEEYAERLKAYLDALNESENEQDRLDASLFSSMIILYNNLYEIEYTTEVGETLGDFFNPYDGTDFGSDPDNFLPMAAALSEGQRCALDFVSLRSLLYVGFADGDGLDYAKPDIDSLFDDEEVNDVSIYFGMNRGIFRGGVAMTSRALMEQHMGKGEAFDQIWGNLGTVALTIYAAAAVSAVMMIAGYVMYAKGYDVIRVAGNLELVEKAEETIRNWNSIINTSEQLYGVESEMYQQGLKYWSENVSRAQQVIEENSPYQYTVVSKSGVAGRIMMGVGGALMILCAVMKGVQLAEYYDRDFTPIPRLIVDEADIVTYSKDKDGNEVKNVDFDQYVYYQAVLCNRDKNNKLSDWQDGVEEYWNWGCGDVADLNGDFGQEWLALYTIKNKIKGDPILADSLTLQYGSDQMPKGCTKNLHFFTYDYALDLGDEAYSFSNDKNGVYFFWDVEEGAFAAKTASAFSGGQMAMSGAAGLMVGILGATLFLMPKRKKKAFERA